MADEKEKPATDLIEEAKRITLKFAKKGIASLFADELKPHTFAQRKIKNFTDWGNFITQLEIEVQHQLQKALTWKMIPCPNRESHDHYWIEEGKLFQTYKTIRGLRWRYLMEVPGISDNELLSDTDIDFIEVRVLNK